jgi:hypothetical protein
MPKGKELNHNKSDNYWFTEKGLYQTDLIISDRDIYLFIEQGIIEEVEEKEFTRSEVESICKKYQRDRWQGYFDKELLAGIVKEHIKQRGNK